MVSVASVTNVGRFGFIMFVMHACLVYVASIPKSIGHFGFIMFATHLDISRCIAKAMNLEKTKQPTF